MYSEYHCGECRGTGECPKSSARARTSLLIPTKKCLNCAGTGRCPYCSDSGTESDIITWTLGFVMELHDESAMTL
jgi:hypothetical protein